MFFSVLHAFFNFSPSNSLTTHSPAAGMNVFTERSFKLLPSWLPNSCTLEIGIQAFLKKSVHLLSVGCGSVIFTRNHDDLLILNALAPIACGLVIYAKPSFSKSSSEFSVSSPCALLPPPFSQLPSDSLAPRMEGDSAAI